MQGEKRERWMELCAQAANEQDGEKLLELVKQINDLLEEKEHRLGKQILSVRCPTCGAKPGEKCELTTGQPRTAPHRDRRVIAKDV
jgi:hypothetical protein